MFEWFKHFRDGKVGVEDESHSDRPSISITSDNIERVVQMIVANSPIADFFSFPRIKLSRKGFTDVADIKQRVTMMLRVIPQEAFSDNFQQLYNRC